MSARPSAVTDAIDLARGGRLDAAVRVCHEALALDDRDACVSALLGLLLLRLGCDAEAIAAGSRAVESDPRMAAAYLVLGLAHDHGGTARDQALVAWHELAELAPASAETHAHLAEAYGAVDMEEDAEECWQRALELGPSVPRVLRSRALVVARREGVGPALELVRAATEVDPGGTALVQRLAVRAVAGRGEQERSREALDALVRTDALGLLGGARSLLADDPADAFALALASWAYQLQGADHEALATALRALEVDGEAPLTLAVLAAALRGWPGLGKRRARVLIALAKTAPAEAYAHLLLGEALLALARFDHAERAFRTALRVDAACVGARYGLALVRLLQGGAAESAWEATRAAAVHAWESGLAWELFSERTAGQEA